jgi:hypothetical protein
MLKAFFVGGLVLGLAAVLGAAGFFPWVDHPRLASRTQVQPNGGRREDFFVRLPVDRIASIGREGLPLGATPYPPGLELPGSLAAGLLQVDQFKIRDAGGNVVGIASRHTIGLDESAAVAWSITLPSRGALWLVGEADPTVFATGFASIGYLPGESWSGDLEIVLGPAEGSSGRVDGGSEEFAALSGNYDERWHVTGIEASGELSGTIELDTTTYLMQ